MALFSWIPKMSVGVGKIDKEHQGLFAIMNRFHDGMLAGRGNETLRPVLAELGQYTKVHFGNEETLLRSHGYSRLAEHLKLHEVFRSKVGDLETELVEHFFRSLAENSGMTLHLDLERSTNGHHGVEALFKAFARALAMAIGPSRNGRTDVPSTKGVL